LAYYELAVCRTFAVKLNELDDDDNDNM